VSEIVRYEQAGHQDKLVMRASLSSWAKRRTSATSRQHRHSQRVHKSFASLRMTKAWLSIRL